MTTTIFLVDDHTVVRDGLRLILESQPDFSVVGEAVTGSEAVRLVNQLIAYKYINPYSAPSLSILKRIQKSSFSKLGHR